MKTHIAIAIALVSLSAYAQSEKAKETPPKAQKIVIENTTPYVPGGVIVVDSKSEKKVKSSEDTLVEIFLDAKGDLERGSGGSIDKDQFDPGQGMLNLKAAVAVVKKKGKELDQQWAFEKNPKGVWTYEFEGKDKGKEIELSVDARSGNILNEEVDE